MKRFIILGLLFLSSGCASKDIFVLKKTETALMDYAVIAPLSTPNGKYVANIFGEYENRKYQLPVEQAYLNAYVKKLLDGKDNQIMVQEGHLVIRNINGGKLRVGGDFSTNAETGEISIETNGGVFLAPEHKARGLVTSILGWIF